jgi:microcompartment protein CcmL/EutN
MTLLRQDSGKIVARGIQNARNGLEVSQEFLMDLFGKQLENVQRISGEVTLYIQKELIPSIQLTIDNGRVKAIALYYEHVAEVVDKKVIPVYNEHIYPVYNQHIEPAYKKHVAPLVKTIEKEAAVAIEKSQKEAQKARSSAATLIKQSSSSAIKLIEEKEADSFLPSWFLQKLKETSKDGERVVDMLCKGLFILVVILCRSLIYRVIGSVLSIVWFFCPLRLFVRRDGDINQDPASSNTPLPR